MSVTIQVYDKHTQALKGAKRLDTSEPEECLEAIQAIFNSGRAMFENMSAIPKEDKERLFDYLNNESAFPVSRYTKRIEEIHEALGMELK